MELKPFLRAHADRVLAVVLVAVGVIAVAVGWFGASGTGLAVEQIPYLISGGIGGVVLVVLGCTAWVSADLQDEWRRLSAIDEKLDRLAPPGPTGPPADADVAGDAVAAGEAEARGPELTAARAASVNGTETGPELTVAPFASTNGTGTGNERDGVESRAGSRNDTGGGSRRPRTVAKPKTKPTP